MNNKVITSQGNVQFIFPDGKIVNVHPNHIYTVFNEDTVSFILVALPKSSGLALMTSKAEDLELNGETYSFAELPAAMSEAFAIAGAQARCEIVDELPETGYTNTIYLVPQPAPQTGFDEYVYVDGEWELIGDTSIEMENYVTKTVFSGYTASTAAELSGKAEVVEITQANYDLLPSSAKTDASKLYVISDAQPIDLSVYAKVSALTAEESARIAADSALTNAITAEGNRAKAAESGLSDTIVAEIARAEEAESGLSNAITGETSAREAADSAISGVVDTKLATSVFEAYSASTKADINAISGVVDTKLAINDFNTYSGNVDTVLSSKADKANAVASAVYVSSSTTIDLKNINGEVISQVDASDFIIDGFVEDVRIENGYLVIDFNTASGVEDIEIPLTDIFNPENYYDKDDIDAIVSGINEDISAVSGVVDTKLAISDFNTYSGNVATELSGKQNTLTQGNGIDITNDVISFNLPISAGTGENSIVEGYDSNVASGRYSHAEGYQTSAMTDFSHAEGRQTSASGVHSHAEGRSTSASEESSHAEGYNSKAIGRYSHAEGTGTTASGQASHTEGRQTSAMTEYSHAEGSRTTASGQTSHAEGSSTSATSLASHAEGSNTTASGKSSHAEGEYSKANGRGSHAEGGYTTASTNYSHAEGYYTTASGTDSHAEGNATQASGDISHAEGYITSAMTEYSHTEGYGTITKNSSEHASGQFNNSVSATTNFGDSGNTLFSVGNGTSNSARHNAFEIRQNGDIYIQSGNTDILLQDHLGGGGSSITIDPSLDTGSTNPVANSAITTSLNNKANKSAAYGSYQFGSTSDKPWIRYRSVSNDNLGNEIYYAKINNKGILTTNGTWAGNNLDLSLVETSAITTSVTSASTDSQVPSAKAVYDALEGGGSITVDSALDSGSTNPVQNQALYSELRIDNGGETETTLRFEMGGDDSTNYPEGCTKIKVDVDGSNNGSNIGFYNDFSSLGVIMINNWGSMSVDNDFQGATYEISGTTVIISYPTITNVTKIRVNAYSSNYTYKAVTTEAPTAVKDQVVANTTALGGLKLQQISQSDYDNLPTKDSSTLYIII